MTLYNCSYGRSDCSLCLAAHEDYKCVWCEEDGKPSKCVYEKLCRAPPTNTCPHPEITRVRLLFFFLLSSALFFIRKHPSKLLLKPDASWGCRTWMWEVREARFAALSELWVCGGSIPQGERRALFHLLNQQPKQEAINSPLLPAVAFSVASQMLCFWPPLPQKHSRYFNWAHLNYRDSGISTLKSTHTIW